MLKLYQYCWIFKKGNFRLLSDRFAVIYNLVLFYFIFHFSFLFFCVRSLRRGRASSSTSVVMKWHESTSKLGEMCWTGGMHGHVKENAVQRRMQEVRYMNWLLSIRMAMWRWIWGAGYGFNSCVCTQRRPGSPCVWAAEVRSMTSISCGSPRTWSGTRRVWSAQSAVSTWTRRALASSGTARHTAKETT